MENIQQKINELESTQQKIKELASTQQKIKKLASTQPNMEEKMRGLQQKMLETICQASLMKERQLQGSHVCFEIPTSKEEAPEWFNFEEKLIETAMLGCIDCVSSLTRAGAGVNKVDMINCTALMKASRHGHLSCVNLLLEAGADVNITDVLGVAALGQAIAEIQSFYACQTEDIRDQEKCAEVLVKEIVGANVNGSPEGTETALMSVAALGKVEWLQSLIEAGADVNRKDRCGETALMKAAAESHLDCLKALLQAGADVNAIDKTGWDALMMAAFSADESCVSKLIEAGSNTSDDVMVSFLTLTVSYRGTGTDPYQVPSTYRCIQLFLNMGAYVNRPHVNALEEYIKRTASLKGPVHMLLLAAGETVGEKIKKFILKDYMKQEDQNEFSLKHLSREAARKQMISTHPPDNLFFAVEELDIPSTLKSYIVYDMYLDKDNYTDEDFYDFYLDNTLCGIERERRRSVVGAALAGADPELLNEHIDDHGVDEEQSDEEDEEYEVGQEEVDEEEYGAEVEAELYEEEAQESEDEEEEVGEEN